MIFTTKTVRDSIENVIDDIDKNPFIIHREADIQAKIFSSLNKKDKLHPIRLTGKDSKNYKTKLVHCEYYFGRDETGRHKGKTFDIVIFDQNDVKNIDTNWLAISCKKRKKIWDIVRLKHIIEIKAEFGLSGKKFEDFKTSREKEDIDKLLNYRNLHKNDHYNGSILYFVCIFRLDGKEEENNHVDNFIRKMRSYCNKNNVKLYTNSRDVQLHR